MCILSLSLILLNNVFAFPYYYNVYLLFHSLFSQSLSSNHQRITYHNLSIISSFAHPLTIFLSSACLFSIITFVSLHFFCTHLHSHLPRHLQSRYLISHLLTHPISKYHILIIYSMPEFTHFQHQYSYLICSTLC